MRLERGTVCVSIVWFYGRASVPGPGVPLRFLSRSDRATLRASGRRVLVDDRTPLHCWSIGTQFMPDSSPPPRMLSAPLRLTAMTLRGLGPYLHGARLEIKPLTILCGENGSGKSTWFETIWKLWIVVLA